MLLAGAVMLVLRLAQPTEYPVDLARDPDGEIVGRVAKVEPGTILLTSEPPGSGVVPVVVTKDTRIMLGTIEGWMNDVRAGGQIKVAYDLYEGRKVARVVEVLPEQGARRLPPVEAPAKSPAPVAAPPVVAAPAIKPVAPAPPTPAPVPPRVALPKTVTPAPAAPAPPTPEAPPARPQAEPRRVAQPKSTPPPAATPAPPPVVPVPAPPPVVVTPPPPAPAAPAPAPVVPTPVAPASAPPRPAPPTPEPARPQEPDSADGSAAVDWFLKGRR